jgi:glycosyltransferase involved in cell wall biosynthesis
MHESDHRGRGAGGDRKITKMNILLLTNHLNVGGITSYVYSLACGLKKNGHSVYVGSSAGETLPKFMEQGIGFIPLPLKTKSEISPGVAVSLIKLLPQIKEKRIDILHANTRVTQVLACLAGRLSGVPFVSTCHGFFKTRFSRRVFPCWGQKVIAISQQVKEHLLNDFRVNEENIRVIHNGIDIKRFTVHNPQSAAEAKIKLRLGKGPAIGIVARLSDVKGHIYLIEAMKKVLQDFPDAQLVIAGDGKMKGSLVSLSGRLGIEKNVFFIPTLADTLTVLSALDLFVLPSLKEGLGLSLMEAMACGICVIGSNIGGIKTLIRDGYNGILVEPKDVHGLYLAISGLLKDPAKMKALGDNAGNFIAGNFSLEQMVSQTEGVYQECLSSRIR